MACCARHTVATESHQPWRHVDGDVITVEDRARTRVFPIQPVTASRRGEGGGRIFSSSSIRRGEGHQSSPDYRPRRHVSFVPVSKARHRGAIREVCKTATLNATGWSSMHCRQSAWGQAAQQEGGRGIQRTRLGEGPECLVWFGTSCIKNPLRLPGRAEVQGWL